jgi:hypothetical protein
MRYRLKLLLLGLASSISCSPDNTNPSPGNTGLTVFSTSIKAGDVVDADGVSMVELTARIDTSFRATNSPVTFTATAGTFSGGTGSTTGIPDLVGDARATLKAPTVPGVARLSASAGGLVKSDSIVFRAANPTQIDVVSDDQFLRDSVARKTKITARLKRLRGSVSPGGEIRFSIDPAVQGAELTVKNAPTDTAGETTLLITGPVRSSITIKADFYRDNVFVVGGAVTIRTF